MEGWNRLSNDKEEMLKLILDKVIEMDEKLDRTEASFTKGYDKILTDIKEISTGYRQMNGILESMIKKLDSLK